MIKKILLLIMATVIIGSAAEAQSKDEKAVAAAVEQLRKAMVDGNRAALEAIALPDLSYGHSGGNVQDKAAFVENIANGNSDFVSIDLTDQTIKVTGNTAIVRHTLHAATNDKGKAPGTVDLHILTVWVKEKGAWKMLARQAVKTNK